ncbi:DUF5776 domain-containing protein [Periweissella beninensis]
MINKKEILFLGVISTTLGTGTFLTNISADSNYYNQVPISNIVGAKKIINVHSSPKFSSGTTVKTYQVGESIKIEGIKGNRFIVNGGYITANKDYVVAAASNISNYLTEVPKSGSIGLKKASNTYINTAFTERKTKLKVGSMQKISGVRWSDNGTPRLLTSDNTYITANKDYVVGTNTKLANYYYTLPSSKTKFVVLSKVYDYVDTALAYKVSAYNVNSTLTIKGIRWSDGGTPRLLTTDNLYVTANKAKVKTKSTVTVSYNLAANPINKYIKNNYLYRYSVITSAIDSSLPKNSYRNKQPEGVVVHETANPSSTIYNEITYMENNYKDAFVHTFVDDAHIINIANTNYLSWGSGYAGNQRFVQFEQVRVHSKKAFAKELNNAAYYTAYILKKYGLTPSLASSDGKGTVWSHHNVSSYLGGSDHTDPDTYWTTNAKTYFNTNYTMTSFIQLVNYYYSK